MKVSFWTGCQILLDGRRGAIIGKDLSSYPLTGLCMFGQVGPIALEGELLFAKVGGGWVGNEC